jgi:hypothetical protein
MPGAIAGLSAFTVIARKYEPALAFWFFIDRAKLRV